MPERRATMNKRVGQVPLVVALVFAANSTVWAADAPPAVQKIFDKLLGAIQANDRTAFVADATEAVKEGTTQQVMEALSKQFGTRLKKGFEATYLCQLKQAGFQV